MNKIYPIGIQSFEVIRRGGYFYVDKTALVHRLVTTGKYYFLSRPRRFGKSLLISTLEAYFKGQQELFEGLAMEELEKEWRKYPVLHLDLNAERYTSADMLDNILNRHLNRWEDQWGKDEREMTLTDRFSGIIYRAFVRTGREVVVLIDEYDKPLLQAIGNEELQDDYRNTLKAFYGVLKSCDRYLRFALLTGVTKFSKVSVFSDLNNLEDISMSREYNDICGIAEDELELLLKEEIYALAQSVEIEYEDALKQLKRWYDGYHFSISPVGIYNPFSVLNVMKNREFGNYWFETGTPTFLVELLKRSRYDLCRLTREEVDAESLGGIDSMYANPVPLLYQSGYLTIKGYDPEFRIYRLGFPNQEVEEGFTRFLLPYYTTLSPGTTRFEISHFVKELRRGDVDAFMRRLQSFFADTPYELVRDLELHYRNVLFIVFRLLGFYTWAEYRTSHGRVDLVVKADDYLYVMEFKLDGSAEEAMRQIEEKQYAAPFAADSEKVLKVGVNFSNKTRNIEKWVVKE